MDNNNTTITTSRRPQQHTTSHNQHTTNTQPTHTTNTTTPTNIQPTNHTTTRPHNNHTTTTQQPHNQQPTTNNQQHNNKHHKQHNTGSRHTRVPGVSTMMMLMNPNTGCAHENCIKCDFVPCWHGPSCQWHSVGTCRFCHSDTGNNRVKAQCVSSDTVGELEGILRKKHRQSSGKGRSRTASWHQVRSRLRVRRGRTGPASSSHWLL